MSEQRLILDFMPMRGGLATAGQRGTIAESQLWSAENTYPDLDSLIRYRPGSVQIGQTLTSPASGDNAFHDRLQESTLSGWTVTEAASDVAYAVNTGQLTATQSTGDFYLTRTESDTSSSEDYSLKFSARLINPEGDDTTGGPLRINITGDAGTTIHQIILKAQGVYVLEGAADVQKVAPTYALDLGSYHHYEFYYGHTADELTVWIDGEANTAIDMSGADNASFVDTCETVEFHMGSGTKSWTLYLIDVQYTDQVYATSSLPFEPHRVIDVKQFSRLLSGGSELVSLLAATDEFLYVDIRMRGVWRPLMPLQPGHTFMLPFQNKLLIFDDNGQNTSRLFQWDGVDAPKEIDDTPPVRFGTEYKTRVWSAGDRSFPLRGYFTASRDAEVWFAPEYDPDVTFDEVINAGFVEVPSETGDRVTGIYGDYLGILIMQTLKGVWQVNGSSPASFSIENISKKVGGSSPNGMVQIGNELFLVGTSGVVSVQTAQTYGDLQVAQPSGPIADKWSSLPDVSGRIDRTQLGDSYFATLPSLNIAVLGMRGQGEDTLDKMYVFAPLTKSWLGPWDMNPTCFQKIEYGLPVVEILMHGHTDGVVSITGLGLHTDQGSSYTMKLSSPMYSGRTLSPKLTTMFKRWRCLKLYLQPRMNRTFTVRWKTDQNGFQEQTFDQNATRQEALSNNFRLNVDRLHSQYDVVVVDVELDEKGRYFQWELESDYNFVYQGCQIEFLPGDTQEDE